MSRSFHQSKHKEFIIVNKRYIKFKHKNKVYKIKNNIFWKRKKHLAYGELRNFNFKGKPSYAGETYSNIVGEYYVPVINKRLERNKNKINLNYELYKYEYEQ